MNIQNPPEEESTKKNKFQLFLLRLSVDPDSDSEWIATANTEQKVFLNLYLDAACDQQKTTWFVSARIY